MPTSTVCRAYKANPNLKFDIFVHKVDGLSDDQKIDTQRDMQQRAHDDFTDVGLESAVKLSFHRRRFMIIPSLSLLVR